MTRHLPLVLDMDGTLLLTDTLSESMVERLFSAPFQLLGALPALLSGRAAFKARMTEIAKADFDVIPVRQDLLDYAAKEQASGREVWLVTAADQAVADQVAARFGIFTGAVGSDGKRNLKAHDKQAWLRERFPDGYVYAGDSRADLAVWRDADGIILAGASKSTSHKANGLGKRVEAVFENAPGRMKAWRKALRLHQWSKNLLVFAPLLLSGLYFDPASILSALAAFLALGLVASGTYIVNDLADLSADRRHRSKHTRPFAAGAIALEKGLAAAPVLILAGLGIAFFAGGIGTALALAAYLVITLSYSFGLKRKPLIDVILLAALFTIRILIGAAAISAELSPWLFSFSMFFFFSLSLAKRHVEIAAGAPGEAIRGRGYVAGDAPFSLSLGMASAMGAIIILCLYIIEDAFPADLYSSPDWLLAAPVLIGGWTARIWLLAQRGELDDDPVSFAVRDRLSIALGGALIIAFALASFG
ncbi:MAG: UbiA family prenyltransferase [Caulobacterales bacterium]|uniref:UbiA family prenyltransferase n=1 Tax=Glycocaulis sp. TaxID=1969725 RepID=UPI003F9F0DC2